MSSFEHVTRRLYPHLGRNVKGVEVFDRRAGAGECLDVLRSCELHWPIGRLVPLGVRQNLVELRGPRQESPGCDTKQYEKKKSTYSSGIEV